MIFNCCDYWPLCCCLWLWMVCHSCCPCFLFSSCYFLVFNCQWCTLSVFFDWCGLWLLWFLTPVVFDSCGLLLLWFVSLRFLTPVVLGFYCCGLWVWSFWLLWFLLFVVDWVWGFWLLWFLLLLSFIVVVCKSEVLDSCGFYSYCLLLLWCVSLKFWTPVVFTPIVFYCCGV